MGVFGTNSGLLFSKLPTMGQNLPGLYLYGNYSGAMGSVAGLTGATSFTTYVEKMGPYNDNMARAISFQRSGSTLTLRVNAMSVGAASEKAPVDISAAMTDARIGADGVTANFRRLNGDVAEVIGCKGTIAPMDLMTIDTYLQMKYAL